MKCLNIQSNIHYYCLNKEKCIEESTFVPLADDTKIKDLLYKYYQIIKKDESHLAAFNICIRRSDEVVSMHGAAGSGKSFVTKIILIYYAFYLGYESIAVLSYSE